MRVQATWKVVVGHHTVRSNAEHGNTPSLVERLLPLLNKHKVRADLRGSITSLGNAGWVQRLWVFCTWTLKACEVPLSLAVRCSVGALNSSVATPCHQF